MLIIDHVENCNRGQKRKLLLKTNVRISRLRQQRCSPPAVVSDNVRVTISAHKNMQDFESIETTRRILRKSSQRLMGPVIFLLCSIILTLLTVLRVRSLVSTPTDCWAWFGIEHSNNIWPTTVCMCVILENPEHAPPISIPSLHLQPDELQGTSRSGVKN